MSQALYNFFDEIKLFFGVLGAEEFDPLFEVLQLRVYKLVFLVLLRKFGL